MIPCEMPSYSYKCGCGAKFDAFRPMSDRHEAPCPKCGGTAQQALSRLAPAVHGFKFGWFEHMAREPVYAKSKKHMKELCDQHDCYAPGVLD